MGHYLHFQNDTTSTVKAEVKHNFIKATYYSTDLDPSGGTGTPYEPDYQSYQWTLDFYDTHSGNFLATYQYISVEAGDKKATISQNSDGIYNVNVTNF